MGDSQPVETIDQQNEIVQEEARGGVAAAEQNGDTVKDDVVLDEAETEIEASEAGAEEKPLTIAEFEGENSDEVMMMKESWTVNYVCVRM